MIKKIIAGKVYKNVFCSICKQPIWIRYKIAAYKATCNQCVGYDLTKDRAGRDTQRKPVPLPKE